MNETDRATYLAQFQWNADAMRADVRQLLQGGLTGDELLARAAIGRSQLFGEALIESRERREADEARRHIRREAVHAGLAPVCGRIGRLSPDDIRAIRSRIRDGETYRRVAKAFRVSTFMVFAIIHGRNYAWVSDDDTAVPS